METVSSLLTTMWQESGQKLRTPDLMGSSTDLSKLVCGLVHQGHSPAQPCPSPDGDMPVSPECWVHGHQGRLVSHQTLPIWLCFSSESSRVGRKQALCGHGISFPLCQAPQKLLTTKAFLLRTVKVLFRALRGLTGLLGWRKCVSTRTDTTGM